MRTEHHPLDAGASVPQAHVTSLHYGPAARPPGDEPPRRALLQCSLHADEIPPMLVGWHLRRQLQALEDAGQLRGEIVLLPAANPLGLAQQVWGRLQGRFDIASGQNFNRHYPQLAAGAARRFSAAAGVLGEDPAANARALRAALREELAAQAAGAGTGGLLHQLRQTLMRLALDADVVLDLHCDNEAVLHLYATPEFEATALALGRCLGAPLALLAAESGDAPYDEAQSGIWPQLRALLGDTWGRVPLACFAATVELRGETDVDHALAAADAQGLLRFLQQQGFIEGALPPPAAPAATTAPVAAPPAPECVARPLAGCLHVHAPTTGLLVWQVGVGQWVQAGQPLAELVCPASGESRVLAAPVDGLLFARELQRWARAGQSVAKVAGAQPLRSGKLLSA
jgi:predicted deacylase